MESNEKLGEDIYNLHVYEKIIFTKGKTMKLHVMPWFAGNGSRLAKLFLFEIAAFNLFSAKEEFSFHKERKSWNLEIR